jgi:hypothetical protein
MLQERHRTSSAPFQFRRVPVRSHGSHYSHAARFVLRDVLLSVVLGQIVDAWVRINSVVPVRT